MTSTSVPCNSTGAVVPSPVTWALNQEVAPEAQAFVVIVTAIEPADSLDPNELSEAAVENCTVGATVGNGTVEALATATALASPRLAALPEDATPGGTEHPVAATKAGLDPLAEVSAGVPALTHP
jgi:hypothetical protein